MYFVESVISFQLEDMLEKHTLWSKILNELRSDQLEAQGDRLCASFVSICVHFFVATVLHPLWCCRCFSDAMPIVDKDQKGVFEARRHHIDVSECIKA